MPSIVRPMRKTFRAGRGASAFVSLLVLTSCAHDLGERLETGQSLIGGGEAGRWAGPVTPLDAGCGAKTTGLMSIGHGSFAFDPFQSTDVLQGKIGDAGDLQAEAVRPLPGNKAVTMSFVGRIQHTNDGDQITGTLTSGHCRWSVALSRG
jgi:hypothetical protein